MKSFSRYAAPFLGLILGLSASVLFAADLDATPEVYSLEACIQKALANSPGLEAAEFDIELSQAKLQEAKSAYFLPEVKLRVLGGVVPDVPAGSGPSGNFPNVSTSWTELGPFIQAKVDGVQPLFTFGKLSNLKRAAQSGVRAKEAQEFVVRNEIVYRVKSVYYGLAYLYSIKEFLEELVDRGQKVHARVEELLQKHSSDVTEIDSMRLDVFEAETSRRVIELTTAIQLGNDTLRVLMGLPRESEVRIADRTVKFQEREIRDVGSYLGQAQKARPELRQLTEAVSARKALLKSKKADFFPSFFLGGFYHYAHAPGREDIHNPYLSDDFNYNVGGGALGFEQNLSFHMTNSRYEQARAEYLKILADQRQVMQGIEVEIRKAHSEVHSKRDSVTVGIKGFKAGRSWVTASTLSFGVGILPVRDLLEAFLAYSKVKVSYLDNIHDYDQALANLSKAVGEELFGVKY